MKSNEILVVIRKVKSASKLVKKPKGIRQFVMESDIVLNSCYWIPFVVFENGDCRVL